MVSRFEHPMVLSDSIDLRSIRADIARATYQASPDGFESFLGRYRRGNFALGAAYAVVGTAVGLLTGIQAFGEEGPSMVGIGGTTMFWAAGLGFLGRGLNSFRSSRQETLHNNQLASARRRVQVIEDKLTTHYGGVSRFSSGHGSALLEIDQNGLYVNPLSPSGVVPVSHSAYNHANILHFWGASLPLREIGSVPLAKDNLLNLLHPDQPIRIGDQAGFFHVDGNYVVLHRDLDRNIEREGIRIDNQQSAQVLGLRPAA